MCKAVSLKIGVSGKLGFVIRPARCHGQWHSITFDVRFILNPFKTEAVIIETSPLICSANGFYMITASIVKGLMKNAMPRFY